MLGKEEKNESISFYFFPIGKSQPNQQGNGLISGS